MVYESACYRALNLFYINRTIGIRLLTGDNKCYYDRASVAPLTGCWCELETEPGRIVCELGMQF